MPHWKQIAIRPWVSPSATFVIRNEAPQSILDSKKRNRSDDPDDNLWLIELKLPKAFSTAGRGIGRMIHLIDQLLHSLRDQSPTVPAMRRSLGNDYPEGVMMTHDPIPESRIIPSFTFALLDLFSSPSVMKTGVARIASFRCTIVRLVFIIVLMVHSCLTSLFFRNYRPAL